MTLDPQLEQFAAAIETALETDLPQSSELAPRLVEALRYASLGGGKRLRPSLVCATCDSLGGSLDAALRPAVAIEYLHTYSLVHDDLPAMDDDRLRRGRATCHIAFDEATAILVGDALQTLAFEVLADADEVEPETRLEMIRRLAQAAGWRGMVGGQAFDVVSTGGPPLSIDEIEQMHAAKTGALFKLSVQLGALAAGVGVDDVRFGHLTEFGKKIGVAFQIVDDILDVTQPSDVLGKDAGSDAAAGKSTYPALVGLNQAHALARDKLGEALEVLETLQLRGGALEALACATVNRAN